MRYQQDEQILQRMRDLRDSKGISQNEIANALDVTPAYISNVENGKTKLNLRLLHYYATTMGVSVDYILGLEKDIDPIDYEIIEALKRVSAKGKKGLLQFIKNFE